MEPLPSPNPTHPNPGGGNPLEVNPGDLHSRPEVDIGNSPDSPPEGPPDPEINPEPERDDPGYPNPGPQ